MPELIVMVDEFIESMRDTIITNKERDFYIPIQEEIQHPNLKKEKSIKFLEMSNDSQSRGKTEKSRKSKKTKSTVNKRLVDRSMTIEN